jgi:hypothetical protein
VAGIAAAAVSGVVSFGVGGMVATCGAIGFRCSTLIVVAIPSALSGDVASATVVVFALSVIT